MVNVTVPVLVYSASMLPKSVRSAVFTYFLSGNTHT